MSKQFVLFLMTKFINALDGVKDLEIPHKPIYDEIKGDLEKISAVVSDKPDVLPEEELQKLKETVSKVNEMLLECLTQARKSKEHGNPLMRCYTAAQRMDVCNFKKSTDKKNLQQWREAVHQIGEKDAIQQIWEKVKDVSISRREEEVKPSKREEVEWTSSVFDETKIYGWDKEVNQIQEDLERDDEQLNTVGIVGMFGSGKTRLAQKVFASEKVLDRFSLRLWVWVSDCSQERLLRRMLDNLGVEEEEIASALAVDTELKVEGVLLFLLHLQLLDKRYLIVFDDVCGELDRWYCNLHVQAPADREWDRLAHGLPKGSGGAIIVTSRSEDDARKMVGRGTIHTPTPLLGVNDGWKLFEEEYEAAGKKVSSKLEVMKDMIIRKCAGLPFALKVAAREMPPPEELEEKKPADDGKEKGKEPLSLPGEEKGKEAEKETPHHEEEEKHEDDEEEKDKEPPHPPEEKKDKETVQKKEEKSADDKKEKGKEPSPPLDEKKDEEAMKKETSPHEIREEKQEGDEKEKGKEPPSPLEEKKDKEAMQKETPPHEIREEKQEGDEKEKGKEPPSPQEEKKDKEAMQKETPPHEIQEEKPTGDEKEKGKEAVAEKKDFA